MPKKLLGTKTPDCWNLLPCIPEAHSEPSGTSTMKLFLQTIFIFRIRLCKGKTKNPKMNYRKPNPKSHDQMYITFQMGQYFVL